MPRVKSLAVALACMPLFAGLAHAVQTVNISNVTRNGAAVNAPVFVAANDVIKFDAILAANGPSNPPGTAGLGLCLEYRRSAVGDPALANVLQTATVGNGTPTPLSDCIAGQAAIVPDADYMVIQGWAAITGSWPNVALPVKLYDAQFAVPGPIAGSTRIGFGASAVAGGESFSSNGPIVLCGKPAVAVTQTANGAESGTAATFNIVLSAAVPSECVGTGSAFPVTLTLGGSATVPGQPNADYAIAGTGIAVQGNTLTASFPANGTTTTLTVSATPVADAISEGPETVTLTVAAGSGNYTGVGAVASAEIVDAGPRAVVVEYVDTIDFPGSPGGHFFYSSDPAEQAAVDAGAAGNFHRTGREFLTGGTLPVCRFYGSLTPGPNSHFFTADPAECAALKAAQITPRPPTIQQWNYERDEYLTTLPVVVNGVRTCPAGTQPLYRAYNNAFPPTGPKNPWDSNHRFTPVLADITALVAQGWRDEGIAFCTPVQ